MRPRDNIVEGQFPRLIIDIGMAVNGRLGVKILIVFFAFFQHQQTSLTDWPRWHFPHFSSSRRFVLLLARPVRRAFMCIKLIMEREEK